MAGHLAGTSARVGSFSAPSTPYGLPVSVVKPPDNIITPVGSVTAGGTSIGSPSASNAAINQGLTDYQALLSILSRSTTVA